MSTHPTVDASSRLAKCAPRPQPVPTTSETSPTLRVYRDPVGGAAHLPPFEEGSEFTRCGPIRLGRLRASVLEPFETPCQKCVWTFAPADVRAASRGRKRR